ncbi:dihydroorotase [Cytophaga hutchinsonii]|uniref:Dihydroorotase n=1 Tax=Cytophaga hutchinsonii (strain ATCC 33406 / DSM 1761 / CIP 103989 / NBRC 15051 / NCIMB 9469 / D465) TaxID=269798 RepID=A0A6N4SPU7_CYTH3|nr:dihydroorotase [Cytophaga hutchinsonii]ABG58284.1 dihydroorotase [Cytophaga hutchinsonii ATCC 33406]SFX53368.1 dihydroorotase [Cytophaga hutchinsonii ATCC 33406]
MGSIKISNANIVNEGQIFQADIWIEEGLIKQIGKITAIADQTIDASGKYLFPGVIDDQVHFREPGLTHKATIYTEAKAAVAGGVTSYMEMPNTKPAAVTQELLEQKYEIAAKTSLANYSFFMGTTNSNINELLKTNPATVCGIKIFMGSSTGDMLVDNSAMLDEIFSQVKMLIAIHAEEDPIVKANTEKYKALYGDKLNATHHHLIRSEEACYASSSKAVALAKKHGTRLHILHISTAKELDLFTNTIPLEEKKITAEACIHHLWFSNEDYATKGNYIKWNPAVKTVADREAIWQAVLDNRIDVIATDHAPHTIEEKELPYIDAPSGGPLVQHSLVAMLEKYHQGKISLERIAEKMSHNVAKLFQIEKRGFIREGYYADFALVDLNKPWMVEKKNIISKCGWSPFEGYIFKSTVTDTFVSGNWVFHEGTFNEEVKGSRLTFQR